MIKTTTEKRADGRIFAGSDPVYTATGTSGISVATPSLTPLMLDDASGKLVVPSILRLWTVLSGVC